MKFLSRVFDEKLQDNETYYDNSFVWDAHEKIEYDMVLSNEEKIINFGVIDSIALIVVETNNPITITLSTLSTSFDIEIDEQFILTPTQTMQNSLTSFAVSENLMNTVDVKIRFYGTNLES